MSPTALGFGFLSINCRFHTVVLEVYAFACSLPVQGCILVMMNAGPIIETRNLSFSLRSSQVLSGINFSVYPGEVVGLIGDNAAGKSTLVNTIMGLHPEHEGELYINGVLSGDDEGVKHRRNQGIEMVYQQYAVLKHLRVWQNFFLGREIIRKIGPLSILNKNKMRRITRDMLRSHEFDIPHPENLLTGTLSGGQRQLLAILRAYYFCTRLLILDEPTAALSEHEVDMVLKLIRKVKERGIGVIFVTHKEHEMIDSIDRFYVIRQGMEDRRANKKSILLRTVDSLLVSSRMLAVQDIIFEISDQFTRPICDMEHDLQLLSSELVPSRGSGMYDDLIQTVRAEIENLKSIIAHFTSFTDEPVVKRELVAVKELILSVLSEISPEILGTIELVLSVPRGLTCCCDGGMLRQVLVNLIINAAEASAAPAKIAVTAGMQCTGEDGEVFIMVQDWGKGMDEQTVQQIFNPFYTTKTSNSGLGLSIVHKLLEHMGGRISCTSVPGEGSKFILTLTESRRADPEQPEMSERSRR